MNAKRMEETMLDATEREDLTRGLKVIRIVWAAMSASLGVYLLVCHVVAGRPPAGKNLELLSTLRTVLFAMAAAELAIIRLVRRRLLATGPRTPGRPPPRNAAGAAFHPAAGRYTSATVVSLAIAESIAIYGVVLFLLGADFPTLYLFIAVSAGAMIHFRPKPEELEGLAAAMKGGR